MSTSTSSSIPIVQSKIHITPAIVKGLKFLDKHQNALPKLYHLDSETVLNIIDSNPDLFIHDNASDIDECDDIPEIESNGESTPENDSKLTTLTIHKPKSTTTNQPNVSFLDQSNNDQCYGFISFETVQKLSKLLKQLQYPEKECYIHHLIHKSTICCHEEKKSSYTPEFAAKIEFLRAKQARESVEASMAEFSNHRGKVQSVHEAEMAKKTLNQIGSPLHFIAVSATLAFVAHFVALQLYPHSKSIKWTFTIVGMLCGFILETTMYVIRDYYEFKGEEYVRKQKERRDQATLVQIRNSIFPKKLPLQHNQQPTKIIQQPQEHGPVEMTDKYANETKKQR